MMTTMLMGFTNHSKQFENCCRIGLMKWKMLFVGSFDKSIKPICSRDFFVFLKMVTEAFHRFEKRLET